MRKAIIATAKADPSTTRFRRVFLSFLDFISLVADFQSWMPVKSFPVVTSSLQYLSTSSTIALHPHSFRTCSPTSFALIAMAGSFITVWMAFERSFALIFCSCCSKPTPTPRFWTANELSYWSPKTGVTIVGTPARNAAAQHRYYTVNIIRTIKKFQ